MPRSISGESGASTVFYLQDEYDALPPGTCKTCCLRCAFPSLMSFLLLVIGVVVTGTFAILAGVGILDMVEPDDNGDIQVEVPNDLYDSLQQWHRIVKWVVGSEIALMVIIAIVMLALGYLATGSVRKEFMCRFKSKTSGRCQLAVVMVIIYVLWFGWLLQCIAFTIPVVFFLVLNRGVCARDPTTYRYGTCAFNLYMVGLTDDDSCLSRGEVEDVCESNTLVFTGAALAGCLLILFALTQLLINTAANYSHLRSRYKKIYNGRNSGTYTLTRTGSLRNSRRNLASSRSTVAAGMVGNPNFAPEKMPYSITGSERNSFRSAVVNDGYVHDHNKHRNGSASVVGYGGHVNHDTNTLGHDSLALSSLRAPSTIHDMNTLGHDSIALSSLRAPSTHSGSTGVDYSGNLGNMHASSDRLMYRTEYAV